MSAALAFTALPPEWQDWITDNIERGCKPAGLVEQMVNENKFSRAMSTAAVDHAVASLRNDPVAPIPPHWYDWIAENIEAGCEPVGLAHQLVTEGKFDPADAYPAVYYTDQFLRGAAACAPTVPTIDCSRNVVQTPDRDVAILSALSVPRVVVLGGLLSDEECDALIAYGADRLRPSMVVGDGRSLSAP